MLNIVIPMAGAGSRFAREGYRYPKPLIPIDGVPMIRIVVNNLTPRRKHRFIFICQQAHIDVYNLLEMLPKWAPGCSIIGINGLTEGAACTVLSARNLIDNQEGLMIANCDQYVDFSIDEYLSLMDNQDYDGLIMTMRASDPKWSYVDLDANKLVRRVVEKEVISNEATVGIYNFKHGHDFVSAADRMIAQNLRVNNEYYVAPTYNQLIEDGRRVGVYNIGEVGKGMYGLGTPDDLKFFISLPILSKATRGLK